MLLRLVPTNSASSSSDPIELDRFYRDTTTPDQQIIIQLSANQKGKDSVDLRLKQVPAVLGLCYEVHNIIRKDGPEYLTELPR